MKLYQCFKKVNAKPMNLRDYNKYKSWTIPDDEDAEQEGYLVVHNSGTDQEHETWAPKHIFDAGHCVIPAQTNHAESAIMQFFQYKHLPVNLRTPSQLIGELAATLDQLKSSPEKSTGLRKLLEAKDCFMRAIL